MSLLPGSAIESGGYDINNSLRFRSSASAWLNRTFSSTGNRKIWTFSAWVKRGQLGTTQMIFNGYSGSETELTTIQFNSNDTIEYYYDNNAVNYRFTTTQVFRDPSAWYHIVLAVDTTQATNTNRVKFYVNGSQVTAFSQYDTFPQNSDTFVNGAWGHGIGKYIYPGQTRFVDGYLAEVNFVNAQQLTPSSFGQTDPVTGVWQPKAYSGTYGTNGFYLKFSDIATTSGSNAGLGKDFSGNSNYWTTNNISVTSGTTYDAMTDSPTNASISDTRPVGNYCTLNPLSSNLATKPQEGNLYFDTDPSNNAFYIGTMGVSSGKWYWEYQVTSQYCSMGVTQLSYSYGYFTTSSGSLAYANYSGTKYNNGTSGGSYITVENGDKIGIALDLDSGTITMYKNNVSQGVMYSGLSGTFFPLLGGPNGWGAGYVNFGQRPFAYTPPTGHKAICTTNLPDSTIKKGNSYMDAILYTGDGASTKTISSLNFQPDFLWIKRRDNASDHNLQDVVRGFSSSTKLATSSTYAENTLDGLYTDPKWGYVSATSSTGFTVTKSTNGDHVNFNASPYVAWAWDANGAGSTNTAGSITSTVSANPTAGFSIVTWTGTGSAATVGHGLGVAPRMIIAKGRGNVDNWPVYHASANASPATGHLLLNSTAAFTSTSTTWNNTAPTSTVFTVGTDTRINQNTIGYVAYCFAAIAGYSAFGSYTGNGSTDGPFTYTGFRPKFVMIKRSLNGISNWNMFDTSRDSYNVMDKGGIIADGSDAESSWVNFSIDSVSNGFKLRSNWANLNQTDVIYIYAAFAENPFKNSLAR